ncbi:uncharacterized protein PSFLO_03746 [Pseudozyma flocculosa]|uniref:Uncharacterized protein n=1 Tax=Pseudozyma flocculosa TaxID=84751 RepID=A0A5C3F491_9BASI|nr:uncharacterized protein PSFLO_03746 [Pseudozyma flocculosa]
MPGLPVCPVCRPVCLLAHRLLDRAGVGRSRDNPVMAESQSSQSGNGRRDREQGFQNRADDARPPAAYSTYARSSRLLGEESGQPRCPARMILQPTHPRAPVILAVSGRTAAAS